MTFNDKLDPNSEDQDGQEEISEEELAQMKTDDAVDVSGIVGVKPSDISNRTTEAISSDQLKGLSLPPKEDRANRITEALPSDVVKNILPPSEEEEKKTKKHMTDSLFRGGTGDVPLIFQEEDSSKGSTLKKKVDSFFEDDLSQKEESTGSGKHMVDGLFRGDTGHVSHDKIKEKMAEKEKEKAKKSPPAVIPKSPPPSTIEEDPEDSFAAIESAVTDFSDAHETFPPIDTSALPTWESPGGPPQKKRPREKSTLLEREDSLSTSDLAAGFEGIGPGLPVSPQDKKSMTVSLVVFLLILGGLGAAYVFVVQPLFFPSPKQALMADLETSFLKGDFDHSTGALLELKKISPSKELVPQYFKVAQGLIEALAEKRKEKKFQEGASLIELYLRHYKKYLSEKFQEEVVQWRDSLDELMKRNSFDEAYSLFKALEGTWLNVQDREKTKAQLDLAYIQYLGRAPDLLVILKTYPRLDARGIQYLEDEILSRVNTLDQEEASEGVDLVLQFSIKRGLVPVKLQDALEKLLFQKWMGRGEKSYSSLKLKGAYQFFSRALKISPYSWKALKGINRTRQKFTTAYVKGIADIYDLIQKGVTSLKSDFPELSELLLQEGLARSVENPSVYKIIAPLYKFSKKVHSMAYIASNGKVRSFYIDRYEVTNEDYGRFLKWLQVNSRHSFCHPEEKNLFPGKSHIPLGWKERKKWRGMPVVGVDWYDAYACARWAGKRLPSEEEWGLAALPPRGKKWPWKGEFEPSKLNVFSTVLPVGTFLEDKSAFGCYDMLSNVREWVANREQGRGSILGGDFQGKKAADFQDLREVEIARNHRDLKTGFRCAVDSIKSN